MSLILLVEDSQDLLELYVDVLEQMGHRVVTAGDGLDGLALARQWHPDLVITDWKLPRLDGVEMSKRMRDSEELQSIPILLQSSSPQPPRCPWASAFLSKASSLEELEGCITRLLMEGRMPRVRASRDTSSRRRRSSARLEVLSAVTAF